MCKNVSFLHDVNRNRSSLLGPRLCRPLHLPVHSGPTVQMTITHRGAAAHLVEEEEEAEEGVSIPLADWCSEQNKMQQETRMN